MRGARTRGEETPGFFRGDGGRPIHRPRRIVRRAIPRYGHFDEIDVTSFDNPTPRALTFVIRLQAVFRAEVALLAAVHDAPDPPPYKPRERKSEKRSRRAVS